MKKNFSKIIALFLVLTLNWFSLSVIGSTKASFSDRETSSVNSFEMSSLNFSLSETPADFSLNFNPNEPAQRTAEIINEGDMAFWYKIEATNTAGSLCDQINIIAKRNNQIEYAGPLNDFELDNFHINSTSSDYWLFEFDFDGSIQQFKNTSCQFNLSVEARQNELDSFGFSDQEHFFTRLTLREELAVVLNEILPNPIGGECSLTGLEGEWVELYNNTDQPVDLNNWYIQDAGPNHAVYITSSSTESGLTVIQPHSWLVVHMNNCVMTNSGDTVSLYNSAYQQIDSYAYSGPAPEDKSYARVPDGIGAWVDPIPTPGGPNVLSQNYSFKKSEKTTKDTVENPQGVGPIVEEKQETQDSSDQEIKKQIEESEEDPQEEVEEPKEETQEEDTDEKNVSDQELSENSSNENNQENEEGELNDQEEDLENEEVSEEDAQEESDSKLQDNDSQEESSKETQEDNIEEEKSETPKQELSESEEEQGDQEETRQTEEGPSNESLSEPQKEVTASDSSSSEESVPNEQDNKLSENTDAAPKESDVVETVSQSNDQPE